MNIRAMKIVRDNIKMGSVLSFVEVVIIQQAIDAAMLQVAGPVTTAYQLPDSWVDCSERMPEDEQEVLTINKMGHRFVSFFDEHSGLFFDRIDVAASCCIEHILVTHWMPLPAAPQQEVKS